MEYMNKVAKIIDYINNEINKIVKQRGPNTECDKLKDIIDMARNKIYSSIVNDLVIHGSIIDRILTLAKWKEVEASCDKLYNDFKHYNNAIYMYNRWLYMIFDTYVANVTRYYAEFYLMESVYDCIHFTEYLELTKPNVCFVDGVIKEKFMITPIYKKPETMPRSIYRYDPNYRYNNYDEDVSNTAFAILKRKP